MIVKSKVNDETFTPTTITFPCLLQLRINPTVKVWALEESPTDSDSFLGVIVHSGTSNMNVHKVGSFGSRWGKKAWDYTYANIDLSLQNSF